MTPERMAHRYHGRNVYVVADANGKQHATLSMRPTTHTVWRTWATV